MVWFALSLSREIERFGAYAGIAAFLGFALLTLLYFAQARELKRLRDWAGRAPERAQELEERVVGQAEEARRTGGHVPAEANEEAPAPGVTALVPAVEPAPAAVNGSGGQRVRPEEVAAAAFARAGGISTLPAAPAGAVAASVLREEPATAPPGDGEIEARPGEPEARPEEPEARPEEPEARPEEPEIVAETGPAAGTPPVEAVAPASAEVTAPVGQETAEAPAARPEVEPEAEPDADADSDLEPAMPPAATPAARRAGGRPVPAAAVRAAAPASATPPSVPTRAPSGRPRRPAPPPRRAASAGPASPAPVRALLGAALLALVVIGAVVFAGTRVFGGDDPGPQAGRTAARTAPATPAASPVATPGRSRATTRVAVLNGTAVSGLAAEQEAVLTGSGYTGGNVTVGNNTPDQQRQQSVVMYRRGARRQAQDVARLLGIDAPAQPVDTATRALANSGGTSRDADVVVVVGGDKAR